MDYAEALQSFYAHLKQESVRAAAVVDAVDGLTPRRLLDIGSGDGLMLAEVLLRLDADAVALEPEPRLYAALSQQAPRATTLQQRFDEYVPDAPFDLIINSHTLYHFSDWPGLLERCNDLLTEDGQHVIILDSALNGYRTDEFDRRIGVERMHDRFGQRVTADDLSSLLGQEGWEYRHRILEKSALFPLDEGKRILTSGFAFILRYEPEDLAARAGDLIDEYLARYATPNGYLVPRYNELFALPRQ